MPIPSFRAVEADVDIVRCLDKRVGKPWSAARAEDSAGLPERGEDILIPPARVSKLDDVAAAVVEVGQEGLEPSGGVSVTGRLLKQKTAHTFAQYISDHSKILDKRFRAFESFYVSDELAHLDGIDKAPPPRRSKPSPDICLCRPLIKRGIDFNRPEAPCIIGKPFGSGQCLWIKYPAPFPVKPARASYVE